MNDRPPTSPRSVSFATILAILGCFALFALLTAIAYLPHRPVPPQDGAAEQLPKDQAWKATPESRRAYLVELRAQQEKQATTYAWVDKGKGIVQLPIGRAMELVVERYAPKK